MEEKKKLDLMDIFAPPPTAVLSIERMALWLEVGTDSIERHPFPSFYIGRKRRYLVKCVLDHMEKMTQEEWEKLAA